MEFLKRFSYSPKVLPTEMTVYKTWGKEIARFVPSVKFSEVFESDAGLYKWLSLIEKYGFCLVKGVPLSLEETEKLARRISFIRETHYGGFWDFTSNMKHGDTAYTNLALGAHTDTTYFTDPIGLQLLHMLENKAKGGESLLVDGFKVAMELKEVDPKAFDTLSRVRIPAQYVGDAGVDLRPEPRPIITLDNHGKLVQIRYNNNDRAPMSMSNTNLKDSKDVQEFYRALKVWNKILTSKKNEFWFQLSPGTAVIFNNWRVLHGRASFVGGPRRMCGCYINYDDYMSRIRSLRQLGRK